MRVLAFCKRLKIKYYWKELLVRRINTAAFTQNQNINTFAISQSKNQNTLTDTLGKLASNAAAGLQKKQVVIEDSALSGMSIEILKEFAAIMQQTATLAKAYTGEFHY